MRIRKRFMSILLACTIFVLFTACGGTSTGTTGQTPGDGSSTSGANKSSAQKVVNLALSENIVELDPHNVVNFPGITACYMMFDTLVDSDHEGNYSPALATEWNNSADGLTWTFKLREGITFSNGEEFDSEDVVATFQRLIDNPNLACKMTYWPYLSSVKAIDKYTAEIVMSDTFGPVEYSLSNTWIIPNEAWAEYGTKLWTDQLCYGTGPWILERWVDGQYTHFLKNENFWGDFESYYDEVYFRHILEPSTAIAGHKTGDLNAYIASSGIARDMLPLYDGTDNTIELREIEIGAFQFMGFQCEESSPFSDYNVRKAFELAIDRQLIINTILGVGKVPNGLMVEGVTGYDANQAPYAYDPDQAKELLANSKYNGEPLVLSSHTSTLKAEQILLAVSEMVNKVGFNTTVQVVEIATLNEMRATGDYDVYMVTNMHIGGDPYTHINQRIRNDSAHGNFVDEEMFSLIEQSNLEPDPTARTELLKKVNNRIRELSGPHIMLDQLTAVYAIDYGITGLLLYKDGFFNCRWVTYNPSLAK